MLRTHYLTRKLRWGLAVGGLLVSLTAASCGTSTPPGVSSGTTTSSAATTKTSGKTVTVAYETGAQPNYIFPMIAPASDTPTDIFWFIEQFWRPLYYFGVNGSSGFNESLSLAYPPVFSNAGRTVTIRLKPWKWSDGKMITSRDVEFWINLLRADRPGYANYIKGGFPDNVTRFTYPNKSTIQLTFNRTYNKNWLLYNQLSVIFVAPQHAWDKTSASGKVGNYDLTAKGAQAVYKYLNAQSLNVGTYQSNPLWQVVDGPYHLESYKANSEVTIVPNRNYSGPQRSKVSAIKFLTFTSDQAEYLQLLSGGLDYGYVPFSDIPSDGRLKSAGYSIDSWPQAGMNYADYNFTDPTSGPLVSQLYIRQALQHLVDQPAYIRAALFGQGVPTYGPVPAFSPPLVIGGFNASDPALHTNPYPYSIAAAEGLLRSHGWTVKAGGVDTCTHPGTASNQCGAGIKAGQPLRLQLLYPTGLVQYQTEVGAFAAAASQAGIQVTQRQNTSSQVDSTMFSSCHTSKFCGWQIGYYSIGGWQYGMPINYPIGTVIFGCGGVFVGGYCSPTLDQLMKTAETTDSDKALYQYEEYVAKNLPVLWMPLQPYQFSAVSKRLSGVEPQNVQFTITPEYWSLGS